MKYTTNLGLKKPEDVDLGSNDDLNYNADIIDAEIQGINLQLGEIGSILDVINGVVI